MRDLQCTPEFCTKRAGRPRAMWLTEACQEAYKIIKNGPEVTIAAEHETLKIEPIVEIVQWALDRNSHSRPNIRR